MVLLDAPCLAFVALALLAAALSGRAIKAPLTVVRATILPVGVAGTFIGFVSILVSLDDPSSLGLAVLVSLLPALYAAVIKLGVDVYAGEAMEPIEGSLEPGGLAAAAIWLALVGAAIVMSGHLSAMINFEAVVLFATIAAAITGLTRASGSEAYADRLARHMPYAGLLIFFVSTLFMLSDLSDPTKLGPMMAVGLLGHFHANAFAITLKLACPGVGSAESTLSQWLYWTASLAGIGIHVGVLVVSVG